MLPTLSVRPRDKRPGNAQVLIIPANHWNYRRWHRCGNVFHSCSRARMAYSDVRDAQKFASMVHLGDRGRRVPGLRACRGKGADHPPPGRLGDRRGLNDRTHSQFRTDRRHHQRRARARAAGPLDRCARKRCGVHCRFGKPGIELSPLEASRSLRDRSASCTAH